MPHLASTANFGGGRPFREGCLRGALSSGCWKHMSVGGDLKFSRGAQDVMGRGNKGSESWHGLACIIQLCVLSSSFSGFFVCGSFYPNPLFPSGKEVKEGRETYKLSGREGMLWEFNGVPDEQS